jgi:hypothetical protein
MIVTLILVFWIENKLTDPTFFSNRISYQQIEFEIMCQMWAAISWIQIFGYKAQQK